MSQTIGTAIIDVKADTAQLVKGMTSAQNTMESTVSNMKTAVLSLGAAYASFATVAKVQTMISNSLDIADATGKMAEKMALSTEELSRYQYAAQFAAVSSGELSAALGAMIRRSNNFVQSGGGAAAKAMTTLGISAEFAKENFTSTSATFDILLDRLNAMPEGFEKTAVAQDLFSKSAASVVRMANMGTDELKRLGDIGVEVGAVISDDMAKGAAEFNDSMDMFYSNISGVSNKIAESLLPSLNSMAEELNKVADGTSEYNKTIDDMKYMTVAIGSAAAAYKIYTANAILATAATSSIGRAMVISTVATKALTIATKAIPYVAVATAAWSLYEAISSTTEAYEKQIEIMEAVKKSSEGFTGKGYFEDLKYEQSVKELVTAFDTMEAREKAHFATKGTTAEAYYEKLFNDSKAAYDKIEADVVNRSDVLFKTEETPEEEKPKGWEDTLDGASGDAFAGLDSITEKYALEHEAYVLSLEQKAEALRQSLLNEEEILNLRMENDTLLAEEAFQNKLITEEQRYELLAALALKYETNLSKISLKGMSEREKFSSKSSKSQTTQVLGDMANLTSGMSTQSKAMFNINKAAALANAAVSLPASVMKTYEAYPAPMSFVMGGLALAAGVSQISAIASSSFGGGGSTATSTPSGGVSISDGLVPSDIGATAETQTVKEVTISMPDSSMMSTDSVRELIERIQDESGDMGLSLVVA